MQVPVAGWEIWDFPVCIWVTFDLWVALYQLSNLKAHKVKLCLSMFSQHVHCAGVAWPKCWICPAWAPKMRLFAHGSVRLRLVVFCKYHRKMFEKWVARERVTAARKRGGGTEWYVNSKHWASMTRPRMAFSWNGCSCRSLSFSLPFLSFFLSTFLTSFVWMWREAW